MPLLTLMAANGAELGGTSQRSSGASYQTPQPAGRSVGTVWMLLGVARSLHLKLAHLRFARSAPSCGLGGGRNDMIGSWLAPGDVSTSIQPRRGHEPRRRSSGGPGDGRFSFRHCSASPLVRLGLRAASAVSRPPGRRSGSGRPAQPVEADARIHALAIARCSSSTASEPRACGYRAYAPCSLRRAAWCFCWSSNTAVSSGHARPTVTRSGLSQAPVCAVGRGQLRGWARRPALGVMRAVSARLAQLVPAPTVRNRQGQRCFRRGSW